MIKLKRALIALHIAATLIAVPTFASAAIMLAKISGDWNDDPYWRSWNVEFVYNASELKQSGDNDLMTWAWNRNDDKNAVHYFKASFVRDTCSNWGDDEGCVSVLETFSYEFARSEISSLVFRQYDGFLYDIVIGGPDLAASFEHYVLTPPFAPPSQDFYINGYGEYSNARLRGDRYGNIHTHIVDLKALAVPEPQSWALLILGFGLAGSALRQRRTAAHNV